MSILDKLGFRKKKEAPKPETPASPAESAPASYPDMRVQGVMEAIREPGGTRMEPAEARERWRRKNVEMHLAALPNVKRSAEQAREHLQSFSGTSREELARKWAMMAHPPGVAKPSFETWVASRREQAIQELETTEAYYATMQTASDAYQEAGKDPEKTVELLEARAREADTKRERREQEGGSQDEIARLHAESKRLYAAANKIDELYGS